MVGSATISSKRSRYCVWKLTLCLNHNVGLQLQPRLEGADCGFRPQNGHLTKDLMLRAKEGLF